MTPKETASDVVTSVGVPFPPTLAEKLGSETERRQEKTREDKTRQEKVVTKLHNLLTN